MAQEETHGRSQASRSIPPKRLIICCDGTWQSSVSGLSNIPSNITRLARSIARAGVDAEGQVWQQLVYYDSGIGTGELSQHEKDRQGGLGLGFVGNVLEAYTFLALNYAPGDRVACCGFSRGAYTARAVAGLVNDVGIVPARALQDFPDLYARYREHAGPLPFRKSRAYREWVHRGDPRARQRGGRAAANVTSETYASTYYRHAPESSRVVELVAVFDTVGSLGIPDLAWTSYNLKFMESLIGIAAFGWHNIELSPYIRHAFQALALDEHRKPFSPSLWRMPVDAQPARARSQAERRESRAVWYRLLADPDAAEEDLQDAWETLIDDEMLVHLQHVKSELLQVWFPGMHINIGGGSTDPLKNGEGDFEQISSIVFAWMCEQISPHIQLRCKDLLALGEEIIEDRHSIMAAYVACLPVRTKDYGSNWLFSKGWQALDAMALLASRPKELARDVEYGWATGPIVDSYSGAIMIAGSETRTPGRYEDFEEPHVRVMAEAAAAYVTNEMIHPTVAYRQLIVGRDYRPAALAGFERTRIRTGQKEHAFLWINGAVSIPEYIIRPEETFSRRLARQQSAGSRGGTPMSDDGGDRDGDVSSSMTASMFLGSIDQALGERTLERAEYESNGFLEEGYSST